MSVTVFLLTVFLISPAQAGEGVSFSWRANPVEDEIIGYRLYYGKESRFSAGGYNYYIDFTSWERCPAAEGGWGCEPLAPDVVSCQDLFRETPECTVFDLEGRVYLALTAYSSQVESDYTQELIVQVDGNGNVDADDPLPPEKLVFLQQVYSLLLK